MRSCLLLLSTLLAFSQLVFADDGALQISDAWIRAAPPTQNILAGYMEIKNEADKPRRIVGVKSTAFGSVEIHKTFIKDAMARMEAQSVLVIPAMGTTVLEPGGLHLMLIDPQRTLRIGDQIHLELQIEPDETQTVTAEVRRDSSNLQDHTHHHH